MTTDPYFYSTSLLLKMDENLLDSSGNAHSPTVNGNVSLSQAESKYGAGSAYFGGSEDYIVVSPAGTGLEFGSDDYTVEMWIKPNPTLRGAVFSKGSNSTSADYISLEFTSGDALLYSLGSTSSQLTTTTVFSSSRWYHVAVVRNEGTTSLYVDGIRESSFSDSYTIASGGDFFIGRGWLFDEFNRSYNGYIDDVRITKGVARYLSDFTPPTSAFPATRESSTETDSSFGNVSLLVKFDDETAYDLSYTKPQLTATWQTGSTLDHIDGFSKYGSRSIKFGGTTDRLHYSHPSAFNFGTDSFTAECWIYRLGQGTAYGGDCVIFGLQNGNDHHGFAVKDRGGNFAVCLANNGPNAGWDVNTNTNVAIGNNEWQHLAFVRNGNNFRLYRNGSVIWSGDYSFNVYSADNGFNVGGVQFSGGSQNFHGFIDDVRVTKGLARYTGGFTPPGPLPSSGSQLDFSGIVEDGLVLHLDAGDVASYPGSGTTWYDLSSSGNNASAVNGIEGTWNSSGYFDFEQDSPLDYYFDLGLPSSLQVQAHTIEVWIQPENIQTNGPHSTALHPVISSQKDVNGVGGISLNVDGRSEHGGGPNCIHYQMMLTTGDTTSPSEGNTAGGTVVEDDWQHFVVTWAGSGSNKKVYRNGKLIQTMGAYTGEVSWSGASWLIGKQGDVGTRQFDGKIAIVRMYNRGLSDDEIYGNYLLTADRFSNNGIAVGGLERTTSGLVLDLDAANFETDGYNGGTRTGAANDSIYVSTGVKYFQFNGAGHISYPSNALYGFLNNPFTVEAWIQGTIERLIQPDNTIDGSGTDIWWVGTTNTTPMLNRHATSNGLRGGSVDFNREDIWWHIVLIRDPGQNRVFINGEQQSLTLNSLDGVYFGTTGMIVGAGSANTFTTGRIAAVRVYNRALTNDEAYQNFFLDGSRFGLTSSFTTQAQSVGSGGSTIQNVTTVDHDYYPGTSTSDGQIKFKFDLEVGDVICITRMGS